MRARAALFVWRDMQPALMTVKDVENAAKRLPFMQIKERGICASAILAMLQAWASSSSSCTSDPSACRVSRKISVYTPHRAPLAQMLANQGGYLRQFDQRLEAFQERPHSTLELRRRAGCRPVKPVRG